jgi:hypothetical protein
MQSSSRKKVIPRKATDQSLNPGLYGFSLGVLLPLHPMFSFSGLIDITTYIYVHEFFRLSF